MCANHFYCYLGDSSTVASNCAGIYFEAVKGLPAAIVALFIGIIAALIAYRQYRVAEAKLKLDLFERRLRIFEIIQEFSLKILDFNCNNSDLNEFAGSIGQADFLFGDDIREYVKEFLEKSTCLHAIAMRARANGHMVVHEDIDTHSALSEWMLNQRLGGVRNAFKAYLNFEQWR